MLLKGEGVSLRHLGGGRGAFVISAVRTIRAVGAIVFQEVGDVLLIKAAVAPRPYAVRLQDSLVAPSSHRVDVYMQKTGHLGRREHSISAVYHYHVTFPPLTYLQTSYLYFSPPHLT